MTVATLTATDWSQADRVRLAFASDASHARVAYLALSPPERSDQTVLRQLFFSLDGGVNWSPMPVDDQVGDMQHGYNLELAVDPLNGDLVYLGAKKLTATTGGTTGGAWGGGQQRHPRRPACHRLPSGLCRLALPVLPRQRRRRLDG